MAFNVSDLKNILNRPKPQSLAKEQGTLGNATSLLQDMDGIYTLEKQNWYTAKPYGFKMNKKDGSSFVMFLPISPSNLMISTKFATNMIPTLYGTVEEHSDVRYFDITIEGTTGITPKFVDPGAGQDAATLNDSLQKSGRSSFAVAEGVALGGFFSKTVGALNQALGKAADLLDGGPKPKSGVSIDQTGYAAFHNLYRFLLQHKKDAAGIGGDTSVRTKHPLTFFNYKDNNEYDVVIRDFTLRRSADNPMLYYYSIQLRGYNVRSVANKINEDLKSRLQKLGLDGVDGSSILGDMKSISSQAKSTFGALVGGINVLGR